MRVLLHCDNNRRENWFASLRTYLEKNGYEVVYKHMDENIFHLSYAHVFLCHGYHNVQQSIVKLCKQNNVPYTILEIGFFPQKDYFFMDRNGINATSEIVNDDLAWVNDEHIEKLERFSKEYLKDFKYSGNNDYILAPLQLESDTNITLNSPYKTMQSFISHVEKKFPSKKIMFKTHPLQKHESYMIGANTEVVTEGNILELAQHAELVYGINSNSLLETSMMGVPTIGIGKGLLYAHSDNVKKLLAALVDKQVHVNTDDFSYWLEKYADRFLSEHEVKSYRIQAFKSFLSWRLKRSSGKLIHVFKKIGSAILPVKNTALKP